jgi:hypothetical protein
MMSMGCQFDSEPRVRGAALLYVGLFLRLPELRILAPWQFLARERYGLVINALSFSDCVA